MKAFMYADDVLVVGYVGCGRGICVKVEDEV